MVWVMARGLLLVGPSAALTQIGVRYYSILQSTLPYWIDSWGKKIVGGIEGIAGDEDVLQGLMMRSH